MKPRDGPTLRYAIMLMIQMINNVTAVGRASLLRQIINNIIIILTYYHVDDTGDKTQLQSLRILNQVN